MKRSGQSLTKFTASVLLLAFAANCGFAFYGNDLTFSKALLGANVWKGDWQVKTIDEQKAAEIEKVVEAQTKEHKPVTPYAGVIPPPFDKYVTAVADSVGEPGQKVKAVLVPGSILTFNESGKFEAYFLEAPNLRISGSWQILNGNLAMELDKDFCAPYQAGYEFNYTVVKALGGDTRLKLSGSPVEDLKKIVVASAQAQMEGKEVLGYVAPRVDAPAAAKAKAEDADEEKASADEEKADEEDADKEESGADKGKAESKDDADEEEMGDADEGDKKPVAKKDESAAKPAAAKKDEGAAKPAAKKDDAAKPADKKDADESLGDDDSDDDSDDAAEAPAKKPEKKDGAEAKPADGELSEGW